ncbi:Cof-type HAD-IIB family hydrolase [Jeotgalibaca caeni]|uniref:Cof-type HAD-IIB family hydrolase n=1 Tax=Jeotgalibaca caeni TaxID=3028623 RepID=UPI00237DA68E|nr:Cof-type HAD-IIB family hydrolase [Jeotgalibaca caeni]MDE1548045.1 Cof-type HAD-IIB family hydrolase [Jeotgalibaca caeni]
MKQKLIAIDLDGTTLNDQSALSKRTIQTLQQLQKKGHHVMIATGRPYRNSKHIYQQLGLQSPLVNFNGALCHFPDQPSKKDLLHRTLDIDLVMDLLAKQNQFGIDWISVEGKEALYSSHDSIPVNPFFPAHTVPTPITANTTLAERPTALNLFMDSEKQEPIRNQILSEYGSNVVSVRTWGGDMPCLEIVGAGIQKALGVEVVANYYQIARHDILAFGDEDNDIEMIDYAGHGVVMKNGIDALKKIANDVTDFTNDEDGLAIYLENFFGI